MMHPATEVRFINSIIGYGVVATKFIPRGTITWVQDDLDQVLTTKQVLAMHPDIQNAVDKFSFRNNQGNLVLCWDQAKYVNHSFKANCLSSAYDFEIAIRDIHPGDQLTDDYGYLNISEPFEAIDEGTGRTTVYPDDLLKYYEVWDQELRAAMQQLNELDQPLINLVPDSILEKIRRALDQNQPLDSIKSLYYEEKNS